VIERLAHQPINVLSRLLIPIIVAVTGCAAAYRGA
jgi:hypothetical protein